MFRFKFIENIIRIFNRPKIVNSVPFVNSIIVSNPMFLKAVRHEVSSLDKTVVVHELEIATKRAL